MKIRDRLRVAFGRLLVVLGDLLVVLDKWLVFIAALLALAAGTGLVIILWHGTPVAADFTRVGGPTRVETALGASRSWITPPQCVVETSAGSWQSTMFRAAQYAMLYDAPLLFTSQDTTRLVKRWQAEPKGSGVRVSIIRNQRTNDSKNCRHRVGVSGLSTLEASKQLFRLPPQFEVQGNLAPFAVFAASKGPHDSPDVDVGLALAAHLARAANTTDPGVSLVVVPPRYLEADPQLEAQLRNQRGPVQGGIVLGSTHILSEDTRTLLRQILTSTDKQGVLGEIRTNMGLVQPLMAALLALLGLGAAAAVAPEIGEKVAKYGERIEKPKPREIEKPKQGSTKETVVAGTDPEASADGGMPPGQARAVESAWLPALSDARLVTVWLRDGRRVTGRVDREHCTARVLRLNDASQVGPEAEFTADFLLVLFEEIQSIGANIQNEVSKRPRRR